MRSVGDPAAGHLVRDGDRFLERDFQARVRDVQEGGAGAVEVGVRDQEVSVAVVEEVEAEDEREGREGGEDVGGADGFVGLVLLDGEGVDEAWVFTIAADGNEECC